MAGYTRQSSYSDGDTITAAHSNNEFDQVLAAFVNTSGHKHDGTAAEGPVIGLIGDPGVTTPLNKVVVDNTNNRVGVFVDAGGAGSTVEQIRFQDGAIVPVTDNDIDLGTSSLEFKNAFFDGTLTTDTIVVASTIGHDDDTDLLTLADGIVTVAGEISVTTLDIGGTNVTSTAAELNILDGVTSTAAELNILDGVTSTTAELNILDGVTSTTAELNILDGVTSTTAELNILDGVTATTAELNIMDGVTSTAAELNIMDGVTATTAELNIMDGVTSTTAELNILDGVTATTAEINILDGDTSATSTTLADADRVIVNDGGTMKQVALTDFETYFESVIDTLDTSVFTSQTAETSVASDDLVLIFDASASAFRKMTRANFTAGLATSSAISNLSEDSTPQLGGNLDTNSHNILIDDAHFIGDENGNEQIIFQTTSSAVNQFDVTNAASGSGPTLSSTGDDTNVDLNLVPKGSGVVQIDGSNGVAIQSGSISIKNSGAQSYVDFYCESSNAHYARLQAPAHSAFSGNITLTMPATTDTLIGRTTTDTLTNKTLTSPKVNEDVAVTATATELNYSDTGAAVGTVVASKVVTVDANKDVSSFRNITLTGELDAGSLDVSGDADIDGTLEADAITVNGTALNTVIANEATALAIALG